MQDTTPAFEAAFEEYSVGRQLHGVPPHEVHEVEVDGRRAVWKRDTGPTGKAAIEGRVTAFVGEHTVVPVPEVLAVGEDGYVAEWHPEAPTPESPRDPDSAWARAAGRGLARLHAETAPHLDGYGHFEVDGDSLVLPSEDDWHAAATEYVERLRGVVAEFGHADVADAALDYLREHPRAFEDAGDPVCCHGWWSPEHVAVDAEGEQASEVVCVLDFEHALAAPGEWDYWRTVLSVFDGGQQQAAFREGYESVRSLPTGFERRQPLYALLHTLYFFESLYVQNQHGEAETENRAEWLRQTAFETLDALP